ncbi:MAG: DNA polymerase III subunit gamma/tau [Melioribacteraceae bacterium]|nr:DNA polymerase III subunit gamma/tau [Melioribacteraceae bacterium]
MSYLVTARKWRPQVFDDVVGQQHISQTLKNAISNKRIGHSYIFAGPRGVGKTTTARIFAKSLNCSNPNGAEPCNNCTMCNAFNTSQSMDVIEIDGASNRRIEDIRTLRESVKYAPTHGQYKIYIIDEVHMLTTESFNALLKTLEEPPEHTIFIFATTDIHKVPLTIISRCQRFDFRRIELDNIKGLLKKISDAENISIDDQSLTLIAKKADGALRDAQSLFDQVISFCGNDVKLDVISTMLNLIDEDIYFTLSDAILEKKFIAAFEVSKIVYDNGWNFIDFVNGLVEHFRNILSVVVTKNSNLIESAEVYKSKYLSYKDSFSEGDLLRILQYLSTLAYEVKSAQNQRLKVEISLSHIIGLERTSTISQLLKDINKGELNIKTNILPIVSSGELKKKIVEKTKPEIVQQVEVKQEVPIETDLAESVPAESHSSDISNTSFENIKSNWNNFVETITAAKFTLGTLFSTMEPISLTDNVLQVSIQNLEDAKIVSANKDSLFKLTAEVFGSKLNFDFIKSEIKPKQNTEPASDSSPKSSFKEDYDDSNSKLSTAIKDLLGGKKL